jgi:hypothetical protein
MKVGSCTIFDRVRTSFAEIFGVELDIEVGGNLRV